MFEMFADRGRLNFQDRRDIAIRLAATQPKQDLDFALGEAMLTAKSVIASGDNSRL